MSERARETSVPRIRDWAVAHAVAHSSASEIDAHGMTAALRLAVRRATDQTGVDPSVVLLDGNVDWFTLTSKDFHAQSQPVVYTKVKADMTCTAVAAASVLAKVARDALMKDLADRYPGYGWDVNKGYTTASHLDAIRALGLTDQHRKTWKLPL